MRQRRIQMVIAGACLGAAVTAHGQTPEGLRSLSLEELSLLPVITVSRTSTAMGEVPAAVQVLTQHDLRRAGIRSLAEALTLVPGVHAARVDGNKWAIGIRGFTDRLARAMLVLIDGRAVYSPLFAGTYWEVQDVMLEDIERIEVVRGPGGTLWGANAVTGIVNVITRSAAATQGLLTTAGAGSQERASAAVRYGGGAGGFMYRVYGKAFDRHGFAAEDDPFDRSTMAQGGFRADWARPQQRTLTIQGDVYRTDAGQRSMLTSYSPPFSTTVEDPAELWGANLLGRFDGSAGRLGAIRFQTYYDHTGRKEPAFAEGRDTFDLDFQNSLPEVARHRFTWGTGYRVTAGDTTPSVRTQFAPETRTDHLFSGFAQDEFTLAPGRVVLTGGAKLEHNSYSGFEVQPTARALFIMAPTQVLFAAVSRAVRTPSRVETDLTLTTAPSATTPLFVRLLPNPGFEPERLIAYELGYRTRPAPQLSVDVMTFINHHDDVLSTEALPAFAEPEPGVPHTVAPLQFMNGLDGTSYGIEAAADYRPALWARLYGHYAYLRIELSRQPGSADLSQEFRNEGTTPRHQVLLRQSFDLPGGVELDGSWRYLSSLPAAGVPSFATTTVRAAWHFGRTFELSVTGKDLFDTRHLEFAGGAIGNVEVERSVFASITWRR